MIGYRFTQFGNHDFLIALQTKKIKTEHMTPQEFIEKYRSAFGEKAPLPIVFGYSDTACCEVHGIPKCMIGEISKVRDKGALSICKDIVTCRGGGLYGQFTPMPDGVAKFVSCIEHYKKTEEMVFEYVDSLDLQITEKKYLNFLRVDKISSFDDFEAILFFATPDILSGLCSWAFCDSNDENAVSTLFGSGCSSIISVGTTENRNRGKRCFIGMLDPSARLLVPRDELTFTIPMCRFMEMLDTMDDSSLFQKAFSIVKRRIDGLI